MICTILLQDLMTRGVCRCGVEVLLLIRFSSHILLVLLPSCLRVGVRCFQILDLILQWWCSKLVSALACIFSLFCLFDCWCVCLGICLMLLCLGVSLLVYLCGTWCVCLFYMDALFVYLYASFFIWLFGIIVSGIGKNKIVLASWPYFGNKMVCKRNNPMKIRKCL
jgi:hypothetical protein